MRAVLDTNVVMSGMFFGGVPGKIIDAWVDGRFTLTLSPSILSEYRRVAEELSDRYSLVAHVGVIDAMAVAGEIVDDVPLRAAVCRDADDEKFIACSAAADATLVSGDRDLLSLAGSVPVDICTPRVFLGRLGSR